MIKEFAELNSIIGYTGFIGVFDKAMEEEEKAMFEKLKENYDVETLEEFRQACRDIGEDRHINGDIAASDQLEQEIFSYFGY